MSKEMTTTATTFQMWKTEEAAASHFAALIGVHTGVGIQSKDAQPTISQLVHADTTASRAELAEGLAEALTLFGGARPSNDDFVPCAPAVGLEGTLSPRDVTIEMTFLGAHPSRHRCFCSHTSPVCIKNIIALWMISVADSIRKHTSRHVAYPNLVQARPGPPVDLTASVCHV